MGRTRLWRAANIFSALLTPSIYLPYIPSSMSKCLIPDCDETNIHLRGVCRSCYLYAAQLVRYNLTTWERLEAAGCVDPVKGAIQSPKRPIRVEWFSRGVGMTPDQLHSEVRRLSTEYTHRRLGTRRRKKGSYGN